MLHPAEECQNLKPWRLIIITLFYPDIGELRTVSVFIPKVASSSSISEPWDLPTFSDPDSGTLHKLNIAFLLRYYLQAMTLFRHSSRLFVIPWDKNKASSRTSLIRAHCTRLASASWAARCKCIHWNYMQGSNMVIPAYIFETLQSGPRSSLIGRIKSALAWSK